MSWVELFDKHWGSIAGLLMLMVLVSPLCILWAKK